MRHKEFFVSIKSKNEIRDLFLNGKKAYSKNVMIRYTRHKGGLPIGVVWAVPKKAGNAVFRNRLKRLLKEAAFHYFKQNGGGVECTCQVSITPRPSFAAISHNERFLEMEKLFDTVFMRFGNPNALDSKLAPEK